jgi:hypothetical protein
MLYIITTQKNLCCFRDFRKQAFPLQLRTVTWTLDKSTKFMGFSLKRRRAASVTQGRVGLR